MAINPQIYKNGIKGLLSHYEIETLPSSYEVYKSMFHHATSLKEKMMENNNK